MNFPFPVHEETSCKMTAILADNVEEEYLWAISLTSANKVEQLSTQTKPWTPHTLSRTLSGTPKSLQELVMERVPITGMCEISVHSHPHDSFWKKDFTSCARLLIKTAILMPEAQDGEVTIVEVESLGYNKAKVIGMICLLSQQSQGNRDDSTVITIRSK